MTLASPPLPRKILMIAPTSFFSDYGGHIRILEETLALQALGNHIIISTYYMGRNLPGLDIRRTAPLPYHTDYEVGSSRHKIAFDAYLFFSALRIAVRERPAIIHGHMHEGALIGAVISKFLRIPLVFDFQGSLTGEMLDHGFLRPHGKLQWLMWQIERFINHRPQAILTSSSQAHTLLRDGFGVPSERLHALPDCVDMRRFDPALSTAEAKQALRVQLGIPATRPLIVYLGLLTDYQGIPHLLQAAAHLKASGREAHFLIMGFPSVPHYQALADGLGVSDCVTLPGKIPYDDAPLWLAMGDVAVSAKVSATEGSGKLLNYMALGLPIVAYDTPVHREYLGEYGEYIPPHDIVGMAEALWALCTDEPRRRERGRQLRQRVENTFTWPRAAAQIDALYGRLLGQAPPSG